MEKQELPQNPIPADTGNAPRQLIRHRALTPGIFGLIIVFFFMTFVDIKCNNVPLASLTGVQLATGYTVGEKEGSPNIFAAVAFLSAAAGFGLGFLKAKKGSVAQIICGFMGGLMLAGLFIQLKMDARAKGHDSSSLSESVKLTVNFAMAYWFSLLLFITAGVVGIMKLRK